MRRPLVISALVITLLTAGAGRCDSVPPCVVNGERVHGGGPRADSPECKKLQEEAAKKTPQQ